ncbi:MAG TPA: hypothetical protein VJ727_06805 [Rhodanobacteraceae bacterium]|nr:hypothetical protein [Rhodanobacteraceae bacterium]
MSMLSGGQADWDEVRQHHDAWMEQGRLELLADDLSGQAQSNAVLLKAIEQEVRALEPVLRTIQAA